MDLTGVTLKGRYEVERQIGQGGMGSAYLACDREPAFRSRRVVVKLPNADLLGDPAFRSRFQSEIDDLVRLEHPCVIPIYDAGSHEGAPYLVVRYMGGGDLRDRLANDRRVSLDELLRWLPRMCEALDFVHGENCLHRDVKPGNVLFDDKGNPYLSDFGIATVLERVQAADSGGDTQTGTYLGSPRYAPPEAAFRELTPQYDQYSLALVVYESLTGSFPFEGTASEMMAAKLEHPARPIRADLHGLPVAAVAAIMRALSRRPSERFASCADFSNALRAALDPTEDLAETQPTEPLQTQRTMVGLRSLVAAAPLCFCLFVIWVSHVEGLPLGDPVIAALYLAMVGGAAYATALVVRLLPQRVRRSVLGCCVAVHALGWTGLVAGLLLSGSPDPLAFGGLARGLALTVAAISGPAVALTWLSLASSGRRLAVGGGVATLGLGLLGAWIRMVLGGR